VRALCTTRQGGHSLAPYQTLNLGLHVGDDPAAVTENRGQLVQAANLPAMPHWLQQVHGIAVADLDVETPAVVADAAIAVSANRICAVLSADCLPILIAALDGSAVAAAHAGWRGLAAGVVEATVAALRLRAAKDMAFVAWLGPAIGPAHFEVGEEVRAQFVAQDSQAELAFVPNKRGRWQCDLYQLARQRLTQVGIQSVAGGEYCTYDQPALFFSHRRANATGRMATLIWRA
jgi:polyphenol oxidase